ncbi:MAG: hypothetical protein HYW56_02635 [Candidatus Harrisonbacteria bacterium]|nr:hypothetical protein [Candidatus Harrisonbacteria bacterium]
MLEHKKWYKEKEKGVFMFYKKQRTALSQVETRRFGLRGERFGVRSGVVLAVAAVSWLYGRLGWRGRCRFGLPVATDAGDDLLAAFVLIEAEERACLAADRDIYADKRGTRVLPRCHPRQSASMCCIFVAGFV